MTRRTLAALAGAALVAALVLVGIGRWEAAHRADVQNAGMQRVLDAVGPLDSPSLKAFRFLRSFQCLLYERNGNPVALELCFDETGRLVEAIDRRGSGDPTISSLRDDPGRATIRADRREVDRLLIRTGVPPRLIAAVHAGFAD
jgi:hypothetical protein